MKQIALTRFAPVAPAENPRRGLYRLTGKYLLDVTLIVLSLPLLLPVMLVLTVLAASDGGRPFYAHTRIGRGGRRFRCLKFRTMVPDAEARLAELLARDPAARREWDRHQKLRHDPRITRAGRFLRRSSLDELPQLINVLRAEMSLVGPRPFMPCQDALYRRAGGRGYYALRPGLTGPWQVSARHGSAFTARVDYDEGYVTRLSLREDLRILAATAGAVLRRTGC